MHNPVDIQSLLQSCLVFCIGIGASAISSTTSSQRRIEGFQMIRMNLFGRHKLCGIGMLWIGGLILWPFGTRVSKNAVFGLNFLPGFWTRQMSCIMPILTGFGPHPRGPKSGQEKLADLGALYLDHLY